VAQGVCTPEDVDIAVRDGLAHRWSVIGPFETFQMTTRKGFAQLLTTYAETLKNIADDLYPSFPFDKAFGEKLDEAMHGPLSSEAYDTKMAKRDAGLLQRLTLRKR
jgi:3-hydroxyacyl-CoA dehydrogenase